MDWVNLYAIAINEENTAGARVVTAPANGAVGIVPAVLRFYVRSSEKPQTQDVRGITLRSGRNGETLCSLLPFNGCLARAFSRSIPGCAL